MVNVQVSLVDTVATWAPFSAQLSCTLKYLGRSYYCYLDHVLVQETQTQKKKKNPKTNDCNVVLIGVICVVSFLQYIVQCV